MKRALLLEDRHDLTRLALLEDRKLVQIFLQEKGQESPVQAIFLGKVMQFLPGMRAAFVDIGLEQNAYLDMREMPASYPQKLRIGSEILLQVLREGEGSKGPQVTGKIKLSGSNLIYCPMEKGLWLSQKISDPTLRTHLKEEMEPLFAQDAQEGWIVRTKAQNLLGSELLAQGNALRSLWSEIQKKARFSNAPCLLHTFGSLWQKAVRDFLDEDTESFVIDGDDTFEKVKKELGKSPLLEKVKKNTTGGLLFDAYNIEKTLSQALDKRVYLRCGGYLVIEETEAMTVIDVNSGKFLGKKEEKRSFVTVNLEAAKEVARQLRLRDTGGIVIVDFIDMKGEEQRQEVFAALKEAVKLDPVPVHVMGFTSLGLMELTRKKERKRLSSVMQMICPVCKGDGKVLSYPNQAREALKSVDRMRLSGNDGPLVVTAPQGVLTYFNRIGVPSGVQLKAGEVISVSSLSYKDGKRP